MDVVGVMGRGPVLELRREGEWVGVGGREVTFHQVIELEAALEATMVGG